MVKDYVDQDTRAPCCIQYHINIIQIGIAQTGFVGKTKDHAA